MKKNLLLVVLALFLVPRAQAEFGPDFLLTTNAFYATGEAVLDNRFAGSWQDADSTNTEVEIKIVRQGDGYILTNTGSTNDNIVMHLFKLEGQFFIDAVFGNTNVLGHTLWRVDQFEPTLKLSMLSKFEVEESLKAEPFVFKRWLGLQKSPPRKNAAELAGAPTGVLQAFISAHFKDSKIFEDLIEWRRAPAAQVRTNPQSNSL